MGIRTHTDAEVQTRVSESEAWGNDGQMLPQYSNVKTDSEQLSLTSSRTHGAQRHGNGPAKDHGQRNSNRVTSTTSSEQGQYASKAPFPVVVDGFKELVRACQTLEEHLDSFAHRVQELGSAFGLFIASRELQSDLSQVRAHFNENTSRLDHLLNKVRAAKNPKQPKKLKKRRGRLSEHSNGVLLPTESSTDNFINALANLAKSVNKLHSATVDFEYYEDKENNKALQQCEEELRVLSGGLEFFSLDGESRELGRYISSRTASLTEILKCLSESLIRFEKNGIRHIIFRQKHSSKMLLNATTVAIFFASVTATTLQYSVNLTSRKREIAINTLWFASLVLSIGGAISGMITMTRRLALFASPGRRLPGYIRFWFRSGYLVLLTASVVAFLAGLVVFVFDSMPMFSFWIVIACTVFSVLALATILALFLKEHYTFYSFSHVRNELRKDLNTVSYGRWWPWLRFYLFDRLREDRRTLINQHLDSTGAKSDRPKRFVDLLRSVAQPVRIRREDQRRGTVDSEAIIFENETKRPAFWRKNSKKPGAIGRRQTHARDSREGWQNQGPPEDDHAVNCYMAQLKQLNVSMSAPTYARVVHLQFSPDGRRLVMPFAYHTTLRHFGRNAKQVEWSPNGKHLITRQSESVKVWTVNQDQFQSEKTVNFNDIEEVTDIQWLDDSEFLAITDKSCIYRVNVDSNSTAMTLYKPERNTSLNMRYIYTLPGSHLIFIIAACNIEHLDEDKAINCIIAYEMKSTGGERAETDSRDMQSSLSTHNEGHGIIKRRIPLLYDPESLAFGTYVDPETKTRRMVISYSEKPPELWSVTLENDQVHINFERELRMKKAKVDETEWGKAFLIGRSQSVVACAEDGIMYFWDVRTPEHESFHCLRIISEDEEMEELPLISWIGSRAFSSAPMMATAGKGMLLKIWTLRDQPTQDVANQHQETLDNGIGQETHSGTNSVQFKLTAEPYDVLQSSEASRFFPMSTYTSTSTSLALPTTGSPLSSRLVAGSQYYTSPIEGNDDTKNHARHVDE
ncbi:hypothetical protein ACEPAF_208 [Sanghuangporus sanghuang]